MASPGLIELEQRNRLPTLFEVLSRRTLAPVDLFSFYIYMRDQQRSVDYLDFWYAQLNIMWLFYIQAIWPRHSNVWVTSGLMSLSTCPYAAIMFENSAVRF